MWHTDWTMGYSNIWSNILGIFVRVFLDNISIYIGRLSKAGYCSSCGWASSSKLKPWIEQNTWLPSMELLVFSCLQTQTEIQAFLSLELTDFQTQSAQLTFLGLPLIYCRCGDFLASSVLWTNFAFQTHTDTHRKHIYPVDPVSLEKSA